MKFSAEEPKAAPAKPRRMQGEPEAPPGSYHALEHDENSTCSMHPVCIPVATPPPALPQMPKLEISAQFAHQIADRSAAWVKDWIAYESSLREHRARMEEALADIAWKDGALTAAIKQVYALQRARDAALKALAEKDAEIARLRRILSGWRYNMDAPFVSPSGEKMHSLVVTVYVPEPLFASACEAVDDKSGGNLSMGDVLAEHIANAFSEEGRTMEGVYDSTMDVIRISLHKRGGANGS